MIDLHTHSSASDGSLRPSALVELAVENGLSALALTDHDTIAGLAEAEKAARATKLRFIRGVEIEIAFEPGEFHLLGLRLERIGGDLASALELVMLFPDLAVLSLDDRIRANLEPLGLAREG